jgi:hypothetical protein
MSNVLQTHLYIVLHVSKPKDFQPSMYHGLGFFGGHMYKNQSRCMCKSNIVVEDHKELEGEIKIHTYGSKFKGHQLI